MDNAVLDYYLRVLRPRFEVLAVATATKYQYRGRSWTSASYIISQGEAITKQHTDVKLIVAAKEV